MEGLFNAKTLQNGNDIVEKPIDIAYNRFYMQMRLLRTTIEKNDTEKKNISITGVVVNGCGRDAALYHPTINIQIKNDNEDDCGDGGAIFVKNGSYITNVVFNKNNYNAVSFVNQSVIKTHIINFDENIIGKKVKIKLIQFLRPIEEFATTKELVEAIASDVFLAKDYFLSQKLAKIKQ